MVRVKVGQAWLKRLGLQGKGWSCSRQSTGLLARVIIGLAVLWALLMFWFASGRPISKVADSGNLMAGWRELHTKAGGDTACEVVIIAGIPLGDAGGGQRSAQLAVAANDRICLVTVLYIFSSFSASSGKSFVTSAAGIDQTKLDSVSPQRLLARTSSEAVLIVEVPHPSVLPYVMAFAANSRKVVVEFLDDWRDPALGSDWFSWPVMEHMITNASLVSCTAKALCDSIRDLSEHIVYLPNAANEAEFHPTEMASTSQLARPAEMLDSARRTGLYFGSLYGSWFRWDYVFAAAKLCPEMDLIIIGDASEDQQKTAAAYPNVKLVGLRQHSELAPYLHAASLAMLPFAPGELLETISPIKVFEYGFAGKATIATFSHELEGYPFLSQAISRSDFARQVCGHVSPISIFDTVEFMSRHSWGSRLEALVGLPPMSTPAVVLLLPVGGVRGTLRLVGSLEQHLPSVVRQARVKVFDSTSIMQGWQSAAAQQPSDDADSTGPVREAMRVSVTEISTPPGGQESRCRDIRAAAVAFLQKLQPKTLVAIMHHSAVVTSAGWLRMASRRLQNSPGSVLVHSFDAGMQHARIEDWQPGAICGGAHLCIGTASAFQLYMRGAERLPWPKSPPGVVWGPVWGQAESMCGI
jgi:hypothetical protein